MDYYILPASLFLGGVILAILANTASFRLTDMFRWIKKSSSIASKIKSASQADGAYGGKPLTRAEVTEVYKEGSWQRQAYNDYTEVLLDNDLIFPCIYATKGYKTDDQLYLFIDSDDLSDPRHIQSLASALSIYLPQSQALGPNTSLVLLAKQNNHPRTVDEYNDLFWALLDGLAKLDTKPWPDHVPKDIDTDRWCFCFGGEPFFTVVQTPAHQQRHSRYAKGVTIVFQPKWIFDLLFSTEAKRAGALAKVRALLTKYDPIPVSPELKNYGDPNSRESQQYFLLDENVPASCPFHKLSAPISVKA